MSDSKDGVMFIAKRLWLMAFVMCFCLCQELPSMAAETKVIYVDIDASSGGHGGSWASAFTSLDVALASADESGLSCDIWVAEGAYRPTDGTSRDISFDLKSGMALYGGFTGTEQKREDRDISAHKTILTGDIGTAASSDNSYHVVCCISEDSSAILDGFTITGGNASGDNHNTLGGGMYNCESSPTVTNCTFNDNNAEDGGGMYNDESSPTVTNCAFSENFATEGNGGGMHNEGSSPTVTNCTFNNNNAEDGGGMFNQTCQPTVTNCTFSGNSSTNEGGAMYNNDSSPTVTNCIFWDNSGGEVVTDDSSSPVLSYCVISGDYTGDGTSSDIITADPGLLPLADNGGPTMTCALGINSSAIDTGLSSGDTIPATDQRGVSRPQGKGYDIGAYEAESASDNILSIPVSSDALKDILDGTISLDLPDGMTGSSFDSFTVSDIDQASKPEALSSGDISADLFDKGSMGKFVSGISFTVAAKKSPASGKTAILPMNVTLNISGDSLSMTSPDVDNLLSGVDLFKVIDREVYNLMDTAKASGKSLEDFFSVTENSGDFSVEFGLLIADASAGGSTAVQAVPTSGDCRFLIFDGKADEKFTDPIVATDPPTSTGGSGGGCSVTALTPALALLLVPLMMLGRRR